MKQNITFEALLAFDLRTNSPCSFILLSKSVNEFVDDDDVTTAGIDLTSSAAF
jgi:hypothetical protein